MFVVSAFAVLATADRRGSLLVDGGQETGGRIQNSETQPARYEIRTTRYASRATSYELRDTQSGYRIRLEYARRPVVLLGSGGLELRRVFGFDLFWQCEQEHAALSEF